MRSPSRSAASFAAASSAPHSPHSPTTCMLRKKPGSWPAAASASSAPGVATHRPSGNLAFRVNTAHLLALERVCDAPHQLRRVVSGPHLVDDDRVRRATQLADDF